VNNRNKMLALGMGSVVLLIGGCKSVSVSSDSYQPITSTAGLVLDKTQEPTRVYIRPNRPGFGAYDRFIVGPVTIDPRETDITPEAAERITTYVQSEVSKELSEAGYAIVDIPGKGVMQIKFIISGFTADKSGGAVNAATMVAGAAVGIPVPTPIVGKVTVEGVFLDSSENRVDAVAINRSRGRHILNSKPWSTWADVESSFNQWAKGIRESIDEAHGR